MKANKVIKKFGIFALFLLVIALVSPNVLALGITPGRTTITFESEMSETVEFTVINSEHEDMKVIFYVRGELKDYVTLNQQEADFSSEDDRKSFTYNINLPKKMKDYGTKKAEIVALKVPAQYTHMKETNNYIGATIAVVTQLYVEVPYPHKYAEADVNLIQGADGKINIFVPVENKGRIGIARASAVVDIYTSLNEKIATVQTDEKPINSLERKELFAVLDQKLNSGKYRVVVTLTYDGETTIVEKTLSLGTMFVDIERIVVNDFRLGGIAKFNILVNNNWGDEIKEVYVQIKVFNEFGEVMADFKSATYDILGLSKKEMVSYWDTIGVREGEYEGKIILKYEETLSERDVKVAVTSNSIEIIGITGHAVISSGGTKFNLQNMLFVIIGVLILVNIVWFVIINRIKKKKIQSRVIKAS